MSGMYDRTKYPAQGLLGGKPGAAGEFFLSTGERPNPKTQILNEPTTEATAVLPGGGGYFSPLERPAEAVLEDVVYGYVSLEAAEREYGVRITSSRRPDERISMPEHYQIDWDATRRLRQAGGVDA